MRLFWKGLLAAFLTLASSAAERGEPVSTPQRQARPTAGFFAPSPALTTSSDGSPADLVQNAQKEFHEFYFTRAIYTDGRRGAMFAPPGDGGPSWSVDFPKGDLQFTFVVRRLAAMDVYHGHNAVSLTDPNLRRYPFLYALEVGYMRLTEAEVQALRSYLMAGGFLVIDDFWGSREWANFEYEIARVLPGRPIVDLPIDHPLFGIFYQIDEVKQVPGRGDAWNIAMGAPREYAAQRDGYEPYVRGIFDDRGQLMVVINANTDLGDAWEWAEDPFYPLDLSTFAVQLGINMIIYGMTH